MQVLLLGVLLLVVMLLAGRAYVSADPKILAKLLKRVGGAVLLIAAAGLFFTGRVMIALPLAAVAFWMLGRRFPFAFPGGHGDDIWRGSGQRSTVRTAMLEMTLDHDTGSTDGAVRSGTYAGRRLSSLSRDELFALLRECTLRDPQGSQLLRAYMERLGIKPEQANTGGRGSGPTGMSVEEAYEVLGLKPGASQDEIQAAHRALMKKYHPDQGGSTYLASKINEAKEVLLRKA
jgi:DnaJ-like protein